MCRNLKVTFDERPIETFVEKVRRRKICANPNQMKVIALLGGYYVIRLTMECIGKDQIVTGDILRVIAF